MTRALVIVGCALALAVFAATQSQFFSGDIIVAGVVKDAGGTNYLKDAPSTNSLYARSNGVWVAFSPGGGGGLTDAPSDGTPYGRRNGAWADLYAYFSELSHGHSISGITGLSDALAARSLVGHTHPWSDISSPPDFSTNGHTHAASAITSGIFDPARMGTGTPTTSTYLRGNGSGGTEFATLPTTPSPTNGIPDAPDDGIAYGRKGLAWVGLDIDDVAGVTAFGVSFLAAVDEVDALGLLALTGGGAATIDSPAKYAVRANSGGSASIRHRLNLIGGSGITVSLSDDAGGDESDVTVSIGSHAHGWSDITSTPTTLSGYGITDGVPTSRLVQTTNSLTGGGDLSANRTLSLVGDSASPGNSKYYGTDGSGSRGFHDLAGSHTHPDLANFVFVTVAAVTDTNQDTTYRSVLGTVKSGYSSTLASGSLASGSVVRIEAAGVFRGDDAHTPDVELRIGSSLTLHFDVTEPQSTGPTEGTPWNLTAWLTVTTAGSSATVNVNGWMDYADNTGGSSGVYAPSPVSRSKAMVSGTLNTTTGNAVDLVYRGNDANADSFSCTHFILQQF